MGKDLQQEIKALRRFGRVCFDGSPMPGQAFGLSWADGPAMCHDSWLFQIQIGKDGTLELVVDAYSAVRGEHLGAEEFDVEEWDALKIVCSAPCSRGGYKKLVQIGRGLLSGRPVTFSDGSVLHINDIHPAHGVLQ